MQGEEDQEQPSPEWEFAQRSQQIRGALSPDRRLGSRRFRRLEPLRPPPLTPEQQRLRRRGVNGSSSGGDRSRGNKNKKKKVIRALPQTQGERVRGLSVSGMVECGEEEEEEEEEEGQKPRVSPAAHTRLVLLGTESREEAVCSSPRKEDEDFDWTLRRRFFDHRLRSMSRGDHRINRPNNPLAFSPEKRKNLSTAVFFKARESLSPSPTRDRHSSPSRVHHKERTLVESMHKQQAELDEHLFEVSYRTRDKKPRFQRLVEEARENERALHDQVRCSRRQSSSPEATHGWPSREEKATLKNLSPTTLAQVRQLGRRLPVEEQEYRVLMLRHALALGPHPDEVLLEGDRQQGQLGSTQGWELGPSWAYSKKGRQPNR